MKSPFKIGISISSSFPPGDTRDGPKQMIQRARAAREAGLDSLFVGDHHVTPNPYYQNTPMLGRLLAEWNDKPAGALFLLPLWHPVLLAEQCSTLANLHEGRFILQCGLGRGADTFEAMSANIRFRPSAFEESLACLRGLWAGETVSLDGRWKIKEAQISPLPPEPIEVWIGATADVAIDRAARLGDVWLGEPALNLESAEQAMNTYQQALGRYQKSVKTIAIRKDIYVSETEADADRVRKRIQEKGYRGFPEGAVTVGTSEEVAEEFKQYAALGFTDIIIRNIESGEAAITSTLRLKSVRDAL